MEDSRLPPELERLEGDLARRLTPAPSADLRDGVMRCVEAELASARPERNGQANGRPSGWWAFAVAMAATVLVWLNLSLSAAHATSYNLHLAVEPESTDLAARQIRDLVPEISRRDARRYAAVLRAGSSLVVAPDVAAGPRRQHGLSALGDLLPEGE